MTDSTRLGLHLPIGTLRGTATASGTSSQFHLSNADAADIAIGDLLSVYTSDYQTRSRGTVTNIQADTPGAGTTRITLSPALSSSTASGDFAYVQEVVDVTTGISNQMESLNTDIRVEAVETVAGASHLYTGKLAYETFTKWIRRYDGANWDYLHNTSQPRGRVAFTSLGTTSANVAANGKLKILDVTFTAYQFRLYAISYGGNTDMGAGNDAEAIYSLRWALGGTVSTTDSLISSGGADVNDNGTGLSIHNSGIYPFAPNVNSQVTVGLFIERPNTGDAKTVNSTSYQYLAVEDIGVA